MSQEEPYRTEAHRDMIRLANDADKCRELRNRLIAMPINNGINLYGMNEEMSALLKRSIDEVLGGDWTDVYNAALGFVESRIEKLGEEIIEAAKTFANINTDQEEKR